MIGCSWPVTRSSLHWGFEPAQQSDPGSLEPHALLPPSRGARTGAVPEGGAVPGRKTDVKDAEWLADLLRHGLLKASFVPGREQRDLRDLTRQRANLVAERTRVVNRIQKVLESANIKLSSVATDLQGVSAQAM